VRRTLLILAGALALAVFAAPASASQPSREPAQIPDSFTVEGICAFPVQVDVLVNRETFTTFSNGTQLITGSLKLRLTNLSDTEKFVVLNASGPAKLVTLDDGTVVQTGRGLGLQPFPAEASITGNAEFILISGPEVIEFHPDGSFQEVKRGHVVLDVCVALT
jgi:hypothetical protein